MATYKVTRFRFNEGNTVIATGLTLEEAQAHCNDPDTHDTENVPPLWFDGYEAE